jgi:hypothetical protein
MQQQRRSKGNTPVFAKQKPDVVKVGFASTLLTVGKGKITGDIPVSLSLIDMLPVLLVLDLV